MKYLRLLSVFCIIAVFALFPLDDAQATCVNSAQSQTIAAAAQPTPEGETPTVTVLETCGGDDISYRIPVTTSISYDGVQFSSVYATTNSVITFGQPDGTYWTYPQTPSISIASMDWVVYPNQRNDEHLIISSSDGGFQVDLSARPIFLQSAPQATNIVITAAINTDGTVAISYVVSGADYSNYPWQRTGARLNDGSVVPLEQANIQRVETAPVLTPEPVTPTPTPEPLPSDSPSPLPSPTPTVNPSPSPSPSVTPSVSPAPSASPSTSQEPTPNPTPTSPIPTESSSPTPSPTAVEPQPTPQPTPTETATNPQPSPTPNVPTPSPTSESTSAPTPSPEPSVTPTPQPQPTQEPSPSTPEPTPDPSPTPSPAIEPTPDPVRPEPPVVVPEPTPNPVEPELPPAEEPEPPAPADDTEQPGPAPDPVQEEPAPVEPTPPPSAPDENTDLPPIEEPLPPAEESNSNLPSEPPLPPEVAPEPTPEPTDAEVLAESVGLIPNSPDSLPEDKPKLPDPEDLKPRIQVDKPGVENGGIEFFGTRSQPQVIGEDGKLTPPPPAPGSGDPINPDAITIEETFIGQPGGTTFNSPDVAVPVEPIEINIEIPGVGEAAQAVADAYVALANIGNDMSPITRKKAKKILIATIVAGQIAQLRRRF